MLRRKYSWKESLFCIQIGNFFPAHKPQVKILAGEVGGADHALPTYDEEHGIVEQEISIAKSLVARVVQLCHHSVVHSAATVIHDASIAVVIEHK